MPKFKGGTSLVRGLNQADPGAGGNALDDGAGIPAERMALIQLESDGYVTEIPGIRVIGAEVFNGNAAPFAHDLRQHRAEIDATAHRNDDIVIAIFVCFQWEGLSLVTESARQLIACRNIDLHGDLVAHVGSLKAVLFRGTGQRDHALL